MKILMITLAIFTMNLTNAQTNEVKERVLSDVTTEMNIKLSPSTVKCSSAGYGMSFLKVLIPELKDITLFDHRNFGESAPCVAAGACLPMGEFSPTDILGDEQSEETILVNVKLIRVFNINHALKTCDVSLKEKILTTIRGIEFNHQRSDSVISRNFEDCL
tara:strand:- start:54546 stop:55028 length:483 start_codon:yes stop_codon:yes gene_type:complete